LKNIILFGNMGSGKSLLARYLRDKYNYKIFSLGEKIHSECELFGYPDREYLQEYGQSMRRLFNENIWCDYVSNKSIGVEKICIDDGRQLNEYEFFTNKNFLTIGVSAEVNIRIERLKQRINYVFDPKTLEHETEKQALQCVDKCSIKIFNNRHENALYEQIDKIFIYLERFLN